MGRLRSVRRNYHEQAKSRYHAAVRSRLGDIAALPSVDQATRDAKEIVAKRLKELQLQQNEQDRIKAEQLARDKEQQARAHREHRAKLDQEQKARQAREHAERNARLRKGLAGLLDRITGKRRRAVQQNEMETKQSETRDRMQVLTVKTAQTNSKLELLSKEQTLRKQFIESRKELQVDIQDIAAEHEPEESRDVKRKDYMRRRKGQSRPRRTARSRDGPDIR